MKKVSFFGSAVLLIVVLAGCTVHESLMPEAELDLPEEYLAEAQVKVPTDNYWREFGDERLNQYIDQALKNNLDLTQGLARLEQMQALEKQSRAGFLPFVNLKGSASREQQLSSMGESTGNNYRMSLAAGYEVDLWNRIKNTNNAASLNLLASEEDLQALTISITASVADLYYLAMEQQAQLELNSKTSISYGNSLEQVTSRYREGLVPALDVYQARQNIPVAKSQRPLIEKRLATTSNALSFLLGQFKLEEANDALRVFPDLPEEIAAGVPAHLVTRRPDVKAAYLRLKAQDAKVAAAVADRFPTINILGSIGTGQVDFASSVSGIFWNLLMEITGPVFDAGRRKAEVMRNEAVFKEALAGYHKVVLKAFLEVEDALTNLQASRKRIVYLEERFAANEATLQIATENYFAGLVDYLIVLTVQQQNFAVQALLLTEKRQLVSDYIGLMRALGGGVISSDELARRRNVKEEGEKK
ncbi:MAG: efflux transporter outer membrane subunit [Proteobacteria bacterium]|nr:efflux transporter outer membrane subunit [Pseudomonadota bacterium]MBU1711333.1 efflux transporter outer membrane subunit [Pseudomonadota bacterium]